MGILITRSGAPEIYDAILRDVERLRRMSEPRKSPGKALQAKSEASSKKSSGTAQGYCIRCGERIPFDLEHTYCAKCFRSWNRWKNPGYIEKTGCCMVCGRDFEASAASPICHKCISDKRVDDSLLKSFLRSLGLRPKFRYPRTSCGRPHKRRTLRNQDDRLPPGALQSSDGSPPALSS